MSDKIKLHDKTFKSYLSEDRIQERVQVLGLKISDSFQDKKPLFLSILNGSFLFAADLVRAFEGDCEVSFVKLASYEGTKSKGKIKKRIGLEVDLKDRHVILVEDIIDSGQTLHTFLPELEKMKPASISLAVFLLKPNSVKYPFDIEYLGFEIPDKFVVGYGMDYNGLGRNLPAIYQLQEGKKKDKSKKKKKKKKK